jgi:hypothetical protein
MFQKFGVGSGRRHRGRGSEGVQARIECGLNVAVKSLRSAGPAGEGCLKQERRD